MIHTRFSGDVLPVPTASVIRAARRWREARDGGHAVQPALHAVLEPDGLAMLAPVFDSLMAICESRIDRTLCTGCRFATRDEQWLCRLLADPGELDRLPPCAIGRGGEIDEVFRCALLSAQIMLAMAGPVPSIRAIQ